MLTSQYTSAQTSLDNRSGDWSDNTMWIGGTSPGTNNIYSSVQLYCNVSHTGDLTLNGGTLTIKDLLIIEGGTLTFRNLPGGGVDPTKVDL